MILIQVLKFYYGDKLYQEKKTLSKHHNHKNFNRLFPFFPLTFFGPIPIRRHLKYKFICNEEPNPVINTQQGSKVAIFLSKKKYAATNFIIGNLELYVLFFFIFRDGFAF